MKYIIIYIIFAAPILFFFVWAEVRHCRKGRDSWEWTHKLSKWLKTKGY